MKLSRISAKGQITIPKQVREFLKLEEGDSIAIVIKDGKVLIEKLLVKTIGY